MFVSLLTERKIGSGVKWEALSQFNLQQDVRWNAIKAIGEKKRVFNDYIQKLKKEERNDQRNKLEQAKE